jgi:hypothetical protein
MPRHLMNPTVIEITCRINSNGLDLILNGRSLNNVDDDNYVLVEVAEPTAGQPEPKVPFIICNGEDTSYEVHAWEQVGSTNDPWVVNSSGHRERSYQDGGGGEVQIPVALAPVNDPPSGPPAPGSSATVLTVKVRKTGGMPLTIRGA